VEEKLQGDLIIIGGAEDKKGEKSILKEVCSRIDKENGEIVIATVASGVPEELGFQYKNIFQNLGVNHISILNVREREDAFDNYNIELIKKASVVFFTGGDQLRITSLLGGTRLYKAMKESYESM